MSGPGLMSWATTRSAPPIYRQDPATVGDGGGGLVAVGGGSDPLSPGCGDVDDDPGDGGGLGGTGVCVRAGCTGDGPTGVGIRAPLLCGEGCPEGVPDVNKEKPCPGAGCGESTGSAAGRGCARVTGPRREAAVVADAGRFVCGCPDPSRVSAAMPSPVKVSRLTT
jgi:hypothetical protein